jgi:hypothetical protein
MLHAAPSAATRRTTWWPASTTNTPRVTGSTATSSGVSSPAEIGEPPSPS